MLSITITGVIVPAVFPLFSRLQNDQDQLHAAFLNGTKLLSIVVFPVFLGVASLAPELITALFGEKWSFSIPVLQILVFAGLLQSFLSLNGSLIIALGRPAELLKIRIAASVIILLAYIIAVRWGIEAVALAYVISNFVMIAPLHFRLTLRLTALNTRNYFRQFGVALAGSTMMVVAISALKYVFPTGQAHYGQLFVYFVTGMTVYIVTSRMMWPSLFAHFLPSDWRRR